jgi:hypothetical protein
LIYRTNPRQPRIPDQFNESSFAQTASSRHP